MQTPSYQVAAALFLLLVAFLAFLSLRGFRAALRAAGSSLERSRRGVGLAAALLLAWLAYVGVVAQSGILRDFTALPPRLLLVLLPPFAFAAALCLLPAVGRLLDTAPSAALVYVQSFRVLMEIILWLLFRAGVVPVQMTFEGRNWDILVGLTAPVVAYMCFTRRAWSPGVAMLWNLGGLALLLNIVIVSALSTPAPFRVFMEGPANTMVADLPFVWLPSFVVPVALCSHLLSLRQLLRAGRRPVAPAMQLA
ncbi:hypothetical protein GCM10023185_41070 [Hymenobacter saemangeumensis]|uniref:Uncharacterized protein n=1 Tax=Hymenobacter saemangeumensis TaxID=1084522 RepID=A0ABP8IRP8_9BACT